MSVRELIVLGTSSQVPTRHRNHNGYLLRWDGEGLLFDPGEGTQRQMIYADVSPTSVTRILVTHFHGDHCLGLAGMAQRLSLDRVEHAVDVYYPASGQVYFDRLRQASIYHAFTTLRPNPIAAPGVIATSPPFEIEARRLDHPVDTYGYRLREPDGIRMLPEKLEEAGISGPRVGALVREGSLATDRGTVRLEEMCAPKRGQSFAFVMDTRPCDEAVELARGVDLLVAESTYLESEVQEAHDRGHMTAIDAARIARDAGARHLVLTHFSQRYPSTEEFVEEAASIFPNVTAAADGRRIALGPRRMSAPAFTTRPATDADSSFVYELRREALGRYIEATWGWDEAYQRELHERRFNASAMDILLVGAEPVGSLKIEREPDAILLVSIYVRPSWQSKGIGSSILAALVEEAAARRVPIRLKVLRVNERAVALYERFGFEISETTETHHWMRHP